MSVAFSEPELIGIKDLQDLVKPLALLIQKSPYIASTMMYDIDPAELKWHLLATFHQLSLLQESVITRTSAVRLPARVALLSILSSEGILGRILHGGLRTTVEECLGDNLPAFKSHRDPADQRHLSLLQSEVASRGLVAAILLYSEQMRKHRGELNPCLRFAKHMLEVCPLGLLDTMVLNEDACRAGAAAYDLQRSCLHVQRSCLHVGDQVEEFKGIAQGAFEFQNGRMDGVESTMNSLKRRLDLLQHASKRHQTSSPTASTASSSWSSPRML